MDPETELTSASPEQECVEAQENDSTELGGIIPEPGSSGILQITQDRKDIC